METNLRNSRNSVHGGEAGSGPLPAKAEPGRRSVREAHRKLTRNRIIAASRGLFVEKHYIAATIHDIAQAAGVGRATVYRHFQSKEEVFEAILEEGITRQVASFRKLGSLDNPSRGDLRIWVEKVFTAYRTNYLSLRLFNFAIAMDKNYIESFSKKRDQYIDILAEKFASFRLSAGRDREIQRIAAHRLFYRIEQLASNLACPDHQLDWAIAIECATDALAAFLDQDGPQAGQV